MKAVAEKEKLDCDGVLARCFEVVLDQGQADWASRVYEKQLEDGLDFIQDVCYVGPKHVEQVNGSSLKSCQCPTNLWILMQHSFLA